MTHVMVVCPILPPENFTSATLQPIHDSGLQMSFWSISDDTFLHVNQLGQ